MPTIVESKKFSCTKLGANANKFWNVTLYDNGDVMSEWGRQGNSSQSKTWPGVGRSFMEKKIAEKNKKGCHENQVVDGSGSITVSASKVAIFPGKPERIIFHFYAAGNEFVHRVIIRQR